MGVCAIRSAVSNGNCALLILLYLTCVPYQKFCAVVENQYVKSDLLPAFLQLSKDDQDSVRLLAVDNCIEIAKVLSIRDTVCTAACLIQSFCRRCLRCSILAPYLSGSLYPDCSVGFDFPYNAIIESGQVLASPLHGCTTFY